MKCNVDQINMLPSALKWNSEQVIFNAPQCTSSIWLVQLPALLSQDESRLNAMLDTKSTGTIAAR